MTVGSRVTASLRVVGVAFLFALAAAGIGGDLAAGDVISAPDSAAFAADAPTLALAPLPAVESPLAQPEAGLVERNVGSGGRQFLLPSMQSFELPTRVNVIAFGGGARAAAPQSPDFASADDVAVQEFDTTPFPVADGARLESSRLEADRFISVVVDPRSVSDVADFYADWFVRSGLGVTIKRGDTVKISIRSGADLVGTVIVAPDAGGSRATVTWLG